MKIVYAPRSYLSEHAECAAARDPHGAAVPVLEIKMPQWVIFVLRWMREFRIVPTPTQEGVAHGHV